mmetsp:Transcript_14267/g.31632  ORF Transcript_14267/g.31632 Transcript_14267/m.31632 type:complete len:770 (-) Transcript_14267:105-2414(-)
MAMKKRGTGVAVAAQERPEEGSGRAPVSTVSGSGGEAAQPQKKVKKEPAQPGRRAEKRNPPANESPPLASAMLAPSPARAMALAPEPKAKRRRRTMDGIAWALSEVRNQLEKICDVEGVRDLLGRFPACVLLGGIAARRELMSGLLGETAVAQAASAVLVQPGMRQPIALELRCSNADLGHPQAPEAESWLRGVQNATQQALGQRLKLESLRLRLSAAGCANLDVVDLPEKCSMLAEPPLKIEEMRMKHMGSACNLLVCLEQGPPLELCKRFDPQLVRTLLVGAAASSVSSGGDDSLPASILCGPDAATCLEERFSSLCRERAPQWLSNLERLEGRLMKSSKEARELAHKESTLELLSKARYAGFSFGRALQEVIQGTPGCNAGASTLEEELLDFAASAAMGHCGAGDFLLGQDAAAAAAAVFESFGGVEGYTTYLRNEVKIPGADVALNGGASWRRLLAEVEVAVRLAHPPQESLKNFAVAAICAGGTGMHGHQRWEDVASKLMLTIAFEPLLLRLRYVTARVIWLLRQQKLAVSEWMSFLAEGPGARISSPLFTQHLTAMRSSPVVRDLVYGAFDDAVGAVGEQLMKNLMGTLTAACINPEIMLRPRTDPDLDLTAEKEQKDSEMNGKESNRKELYPALKRREARQRVTQEMRKRSGPSGGLPAQLQDRIFDPKDVKSSAPLVIRKLHKAFGTLAGILATQAYAFADASLTTLSRREVDEAMNGIDFSPEQRRILEARHQELYDVAKEVDGRLESVKKCLSILRSAR